MSDAHIKAAKSLLVQGYSLIVTTSRRTPRSALARWRALAQEHSNVWLYNPADTPNKANPYLTFLEIADILLVTQDSTNMLT